MLMVAPATLNLVGALHANCQSSSLAERILRRLDPILPVAVLVGLLVIANLLILGPTIYRRIEGRTAAEA